MEDEEEVEGEAAMDLYSKSATSVGGAYQSGRALSGAPCPTRQPPFPDAISPGQI
jgi:hypothetical protein